jgi:hypothetical protein
MSLISQTVNYTTPGEYTYTVPSGVSSLEFHIWGAGGASGSGGPTRSVEVGAVTSQIQTGTTQVKTGVALRPDGTKRVQVGTRQVQTGTVQVQTGTTQVQTGTTQVKTGTKQEAYQVVQQNSKGGKNSYNNGKGSGTTYVTKYRTVDVFETRPVFTTVAVFGSQPVYTSVPIYEDQTVFTEESTFDLLPVFSPVSTPIYENRSGGPGGTGAGGGYSNRKIKVTAGDILRVYVGGSGTSYLGGFSYTNYTGGSAGSASATGRGGGGGGATVVTLNGTVVAVAAGGGGGGGGGTLGATGANGSPARISGSRRDDSKGQDSAAGPSTGGGGGGGMRDGGGLAGSSGSVGGGGDGGISFGTIIQAGNGTAPGGLTVRSYPGRNAGRAGYSGAAILTFTKSFNINIKQSNQWKSIDRAWVKIDGQWKEILNGWTKVSGTWQPLITSRSIEGAENTVAPAITYALSGNASSVNEGVAVGFTLSTTGLSAGAIVPYTASGLNTADLAAGSLTGSFIVGTTDTITFATKPDNTTTGVRNLKVYINNTDTVANCTILDTSLTPGYSVAGNVASINENQAVRFILANTNGIAGETIRYEITGISSSRLASGSDPLTGTFVVGSDERTDIALSNNLNTDGASTMTITLVGKGASATCAVVDTSVTPYENFTQTYTISAEGPGNWTVPAYVTSLSVSVTGGGGGGGANHTSCGVSSHRGGNGGAGFVGTGTLSVSAGQVISYNVGSGGAGGGSSKDNGSSGGASSFGSIQGAAGPGGTGGTTGQDAAGGTGGNNGLGGVYKSTAGSRGGAGRITITASGSRPVR